MTPQALAKSSLLRILLPLGLVLSAVFLTVRQADVLLGKAFHAAFGDGHAAQFESVWFDWSGNVTAKQVVIRPAAAAAGGEVRFERVWLETPGWGFFLRNALDRSLAQAALPRLHLVLGDARELEGLATLVPELGPVGPASAAMFEAEGCGKATSFGREELAAMGLSAGDTSLEIDQRVEGDAMAMSVALTTPGSSRAQLDRSGRLPAPRASLLGERAAPRIEADRWSVRDQGFVSARNRYCAAQDGVTPRDTLESHIAGIDRRAQEAGLAFDENARAFYRRFARSGGEMSFGGAYQPPLTPEEARHSGGSGPALARMNATLERDTRAVPIVWRLVTPTGEAAVAQISSSTEADPPTAPDTVPASTEASPEVAASAPTATPVHSNTTVPSDTAGNASSAAVPSNSTYVAAVPADAAETISTSAPPSPTQTASSPVPPPPATSAPAATTPATDPPPPQVPAAATASATPPRNASAPRIERAPPAPRRDTLAFEELASHRGRQVRLWTMHNPPRTVLILDGDAAEVRVRTKLGGGAAEYTVKREGFLRATLVR